MGTDVTDALMAELNKFINGESSPPTRNFSNLTPPTGGGGSVEMSRSIISGTNSSELQTISGHIITGVVRDLSKSRNASQIDPTHRGSISTAILGASTPQDMAWTTPRMRASSVLQKPQSGACPKCQFFHLGNECAADPCRACGTTSAHSSKCPNIPKNTSQGELQSAVDMSSINGRQSKTDFRVSRTGRVSGMNSYPQKLSHACQKRGFNPYIRTFSSPNGKSHMANVAFGNPPDFTIDLGLERFNCAQNAREAAAKKGLEFLVANPMYRPGQEKAKSASFSHNKRPEGIHKVTEQVSKKAVDSPIVPGAIPCGGKLGHALIRPRAVPLSPRIKADTCPESSLPKEGGIKAPSDKAHVTPKLVDLPSNVEAVGVEGVVRQALAPGTASIIFNLPGNVSAEVAEAYGRAFSRLSENHPRRRPPSRGRSRSPPRQPLAERNRRERNYRWSPPRHPRPYGGY